MISLSETWPERLRESAPHRHEAIGELRSILMRALRAGLSGRAGSDEAFVEDVTQESLLRILERLDTFEGRSKFTSWAISIAMRIAFNELRKREWKHVSLDELRERAGSLAEPEDKATQPDASAAQTDLSAFLHSIIRTKLTERQQEVLFCELSGMPQEEIARQLNTNRNNVYKLFHDARKALKRELERIGFDRTSLIPGPVNEPSNDYTSNR